MTATAAATTAATATAPVRRAHRPMVSAKLASDGVDARGVIFTTPGRIGRQLDAPSALYFPVGWEATNGTARARIVGVEVKPGQPDSAAATTGAAESGSPRRPPLVVRLLLSDTRGFKPFDTLTAAWGGEFPSTNCFFFYGFYGLGAYEDVFAFGPGSLGIHVDSSCMVWAGWAIQRGIGATFGVTAEPLSAGIPYGDLVLLALASGYDWAEAAYGGLQFGQRWAGVLFGDPIYAPFRSLQAPDGTAPVIEAAAARVEPKTAHIQARLAGAGADEQADVALWRLEWGPTQAYGQVVDFYHWPQPDSSSRGVPDRRYTGYSRHFRHSLRSLWPGQTYHYRLIARDPAGNVSTTNDATFRVPEGK